MYKIGFIGGTTLMPGEDYVDLMNWKRCNVMVRGWLVSSTEKDIKSSVKHVVIAHDIWHDS